MGLFNKKEIYNKEHLGVILSELLQEGIIEPDIYEHIFGIFSKIFTSDNNTDIFLVLPRALPDLCELKSRIAFSDMDKNRKEYLTQKLEGYCNEMQKLKNKLYTEIL
ncbi:MAG: hypothetical protein PHW96_03025 [Candidatus Nanoarchaeia archaeon]|nr:hypothetical protein [Candidatus Nanoarchaeia archaeon]